MPPSLTWLHLSDLHLCPEKTDWDSKRVLRALRKDLSALRTQHGLKPDLLLFTGDAAFGELNGSSIAGQFKAVKAFFEELRGLCKLPKDRVFLVPGNHDLHQQKILRGSKSLRATISLEELLDVVRDADGDWQNAMLGLAEYRALLEDAGFTHLLDDPKRLVYAKRLDINGIDVGIAGLNSAWSCYGDDEGKLWLGGEWQLNEVEAQIHDAQVKIGLIHHPLRGWIRKEESEDLEVRFADSFDFHLHGHEHKPWVWPLADGTVRIAAGACYNRQRSDRPAAYNLVRLDPQAGRGEVWLRQYQEDRSRWIAHDIADDPQRPGIWPLESLRCFPKATPTVDPPPAAEPPKPTVDPIDAWLRHVRAEHSTLLSHFARRGGVALLEHVYVELRLRERGGVLAAKGIDPERPDPQGHDALTLRHVLEKLDPSRFGRRWLLRGDPGSGKTTLLRHLAYKLAQERAQDGARWVPVFLSLPRTLRAGAEPLEALDEKLRGAFGLMQGDLSAALTEVADRGELLFLFDGLDEVHEDERETARALLRNTAERWPDVPLVVTTRPIGAEALLGFHELELLPFDGERRRRFLARWLGEGNSEDRPGAEVAAASLESKRHLKELSSNPLYLTLMAMLLKEEDEEEPLPERRTQLYDRIFDYLLDGKHREKGSAIAQRRTVEEGLRHLAWEMTTEALDAEPLGGLEDRLSSNEPLMQRLSRLARWKENPRAFLEEVAEKTGILGPHDGADADWRYWHRTFREALAAQCLEERLKGKGEAALLDHVREIKGSEGQWGEPYALLAGRLDEPDVLVEKLMDTHQALGLRALASAEGLQPETVDRLLVALGKASDRLGKDLPDYVEVQDWMARAEVYRRIPELLGKADDALELLDRWRQRTTDGNDLFFIDLAMVEVAQRWPGEAVAAKVEDFRARLFDHLEPPGTFEGIAVPVDPLWREIPSGDFLMGTSDDEPNYPKHPLGAYSDERPQHKVEISSPFDMASIPVTNAQYCAFDPNHEPYAWEGVSAAELDDHPVVNVTWYAAVIFSRWLARALPGVRLATEEEWEYACRAGTTSRFWSGDEEADLKRVGWYNENSEGRTHRVGELPANEWGLFDMHGNVREWTQSPWTGDYSNHKSGRTVDPSSTPAASPADLAGDTAATPGGRRVIRGGCYRFTARNVRSAYRFHWNPWYRHRDRGFRLVRPLPPPSEP